MKIPTVDSSCYIAIAPFVSTCSPASLTVDVYQTHGRIALESGDMDEYNQCQSRLKELHLAGVAGVKMDEFTAYRLVYSLYRENHRCGQSLADLPLASWRLLLSYFFPYPRGSCGPSIAPNRPREVAGWVGGHMLVFEWSYFAPRRKKRVAKMPLDNGDRVILRSTVLIIRALSRDCCPFSVTE